MRLAHYKVCYPTQHLGSQHSHSGWTDETSQADRSLKSVLDFSTAAEHHGPMTIGAEVSLAFFQKAVRRIVEDVVPGSGYFAGRLGSGSDVLGFDDGLSSDHDFGCRLTVLVDDEHASLVTDIDQALSDRLPNDFDGWPTRFPVTWDEQPRHRVDIHTVHEFATSRLGIDLRSPLRPTDWLCLTGQSILEVSAGRIFHDATRTFAEVLRMLTWYPDDVWYYVLAAGWTRLARELPFVGRTGQVGDDAGSRIIASRLCRDVMMLTFLIERSWVPYPKWSGSALRRLHGGANVVEQLTSIQLAPRWDQRQTKLADLIEGLAKRHRLAGLELPAPAVVPFYDRPFLTTSEEVSQSLRERIDDPAVGNLPPIGSIEQWCDNVDLLTQPERRVHLKTIYNVE